MFTGLVETVGTVRGATRRNGGMRLHIQADFPSGGVALRLGDSIAVDGSCLTVVALSGTSSFTADASPETLTLTTLGDLHPGDTVNLERSLTPASPMGGHFVSGHVDGTGRIIGLRDEGGFTRFSIQLDETMTPFVAPKGSITLSGVSLTVNRYLDPTVIELMLIPHTLSSTTLGRRDVGDRLNVEVDMLARYVVRTLSRLGVVSPNADFPRVQGEEDSSRWSSLLAPLGSPHDE